MWWSLAERVVLSFLHTLLPMLKLPVSSSHSFVFVKASCLSPSYTHKTSIIHSLLLLAVVAVIQLSRLVSIPSE